MLRSALCLLLLVGCYSSFGEDSPGDVTDRIGLDGGARDGAPPPRDLSFADAVVPDLGIRDFGPLPDLFVEVDDLGTRDFGPPPDLGSRDAGPRPDLGSRDAGPRPDLGMSDAAVGLDAGPPPPPTGCELSSPPPLDADGLREEAYWFDSGHPNANSLPLVVDLVPGDGDPRPSVIWTRSNFAETQGSLTTARVDEALRPLGAAAVDPTANPAAADLDGDGDLEVVTLLPGAGTIAVHHDGRELWRSDRPTAAERAYGGVAARGGAVTLADLEGDGTVEVIVGKHILEGATGAPRAVAASGDRGIHAGVGPMACVGDVDRDGMQEVIVGGTAYGANGAVEWDAPAVPDGLCAIGDVTAAPGVEVVVVAEGSLYVLSGPSGALLERRPLEGFSADGPGGGPPALADVDGDGTMEIAVAHGDAVAVYDFACAAGVPCVGALRWRAAMIERSRTAGVTFGDLNADGQWELFTNDRFSLYVRRGRDGSLVTARATASASIAQAPIVADVDLDGDAEIIVPSSRLAARGIYVEPPRPGIQVLGKRDGSWTGARAIWNQHAYHVTNVTDSGALVSGPITDFRAQSLGDDPLALPNLVGSATVECLGGGEALIRVSVLNAGLGPAGDFVVELTRGVRDIPVTVVSVAGPLNPGERADVAIFETWEPPMQLYVDRRRNGNVWECDESDNRIDLPMLVCP